MKSIYLILFKRAPYVQPHLFHQSCGFWPRPRIGATWVSLVPWSINSLCWGWSSHLLSGQITIIPTPELRGFWGDSLTKPPFGVTSAEVAIICPAFIGIHIMGKKDPYGIVLMSLSPIRRKFRSLTSDNMDS